MDLRRAWTREPWISRQARHLETTVADSLLCYNKCDVDEFWITVTQVYLQRNMVSYVQGGMQAKGIWKKDPDAYI